MDNEVLICEMRFFEYGSPAPEGSRYKGTVDSESLAGYIEYTQREEANEKHCEDTLHEGGYLGYTSKEESTFSSVGWLNDENEKHFRKELLDSFSNPGDLWWEIIFSIESFDTAYKFGLKNVDDYKEYVSSTMNGIFKQMGFDGDNMLWWGNYHKDTTHPHVHINFMEIDKTRIKGKLRKNELKKVKIEFAKNLDLRTKLEEYTKMSSEEFFENKDIRFNDLLEVIDRYVLAKPIKSVSELYKILPDTGRLQYNSVHMKPFRKQIDMVVAEVLKDSKIKRQLKSYYDTIEVLASNMDDYYSSNNNKADVNTIVSSEQRRLHERIANLILKKYKTKVIVKRVKPGGKHRAKGKRKDLKQPFGNRYAKKITQRYLDFCNFQIQREMDEWQKANDIYDSI